MKGEINLRPGVGPDTRAETGRFDSAADDGSRRPRGQGGDVARERDVRRPRHLCVRRKDGRQAARRRARYAELRTRDTEAWIERVLGQPRKALETTPRIACRQSTQSARPLPSCLICPGATYVVPCEVPYGIRATTPHLDIDRLECMASGATVLARSVPLCFAQVVNARLLAHKGRPISWASRIGWSITSVISRWDPARARYLALGPRLDRGVRPRTVALRRCSYFEGCHPGPA